MKSVLMSLPFFQSLAKVGYSVTFTDQCAIPNRFTLFLSTISTCRCLGRLYWVIISFLPSPSLCHRRWQIPHRRFAGVAATITTPFSSLSRLTWRFISTTRKLADLSPSRYRKDVTKFDGTRSVCCDWNGLFTVDRDRWSECRCATYRIGVTNCWLSLTSQIKVGIYPFVDSLPPVQLLN